MSEHTPGISVIVPAYNAEKSLRRCLDSILAQTYTDWECLVIDDGSTDDTPAICDEYATADTRFRVFHKQNDGVSSARNIGLENLRGEWVTFVDADDWIFSHSFSSYESHFKEKCDCIVLGFESDNALFNSPDKDFMNRRHHGICFEGCFKDGLALLYSNSIAGYLWCKAFKTNIIRTHQVYFNSSFNYREDEEFFLRYGTYCNTIICSRTIVTHYCVPNCDEKYTRRGDMFDLQLSCVDSLKKIYPDEFHHKTGNKVVELTMELQLLYIRKDPLRKEKLRQYRDMLGKNILDTNLFWLTKYTVYLDPTLVVSDCVLRLHTTIKKLLKDNG